MTETSSFQIPAASCLPDGCFVGGGCAIIRNHAGDFILTILHGLSDVSGKNARLCVGHSGASTLLLLDGSSGVI